MSNRRRVGVGKKTKFEGFVVFSKQNWREMVKRKNLKMKKILDMRVPRTKVECNKHTLSKIWCVTP